MTMKMNSIQPSSAFQLAKVNGTRSPVSSIRTMRNWPACAALAILGAWTRNSKTFSENCVFFKILNMRPLSVRPTGRRAKYTALVVRYGSVRKAISFNGGGVFDG